MDEDITIVFMHLVMLVHDRDALFIYLHHDLESYSLYVPTHIAAKSNRSSMIEGCYTFMLK